MKSIRTTALLGLALLASTGFATAATSKTAIKPVAHGMTKGEKPLAKMPGHHSNLIAQNKIKALMASGKLSDTKNAKDGWTGSGKGPSNTAAGM